MKFEVEHTDTCGGDANYSWVQREVIEVPEDATDRMIVLRAKRAVGMTGVDCRKANYGDLIELRPRAMNTVIFISYLSD
jgi:hypothetical protein